MKKGEDSKCGLINTAYSTIGEQTINTNLVWNVQKNYVSRKFNFLFN